MSASLACFTSGDASWFQTGVSTQALGVHVGGEEQPDQGAIGPGHHYPGHLRVAHPVRQRRGVFAGPHGGHAETHHRPCLSVCWEIGKHTSELQSQSNLVCRLLLEKKKKRYYTRRC